LHDQVEDADMSNDEPSESEGDQPAGSTAAVDTNMRQRRLALIMGLGSLITGGICLYSGWNWNTLTVLLWSTGVALVLYWKTGADPKGFGKAIWGKKNAD